MFVSDPAGVQNIKSKVVSLSFKAGKDKVTVNNTKSPIVIKLQNKPLQGKNISLFMPGKIKVHAVKLDSLNCNLMLNINPVNDFNNKTELFVFGQYGKPASKQNHDFQLVISPGKRMKLLKNNQAVHRTMMSNSSSLSPTTGSSNTDFINVTLERNSNIEIIDNNTLVMWSFKDFTYGFMNNSRLYLALKYEGPMPALVLLDNPYTYDIIEERGAYNYSLKTVCADCSYWNKEEAKWKKDGCAVGSSYMLQHPM